MENKFSNRECGLGRKLIRRLAVVGGGAAAAAASRHEIEPQLAGSMEVV